MEFGEDVRNGSIERQAKGRVQEHGERKER